MDALICPNRCIKLAETFWPLKIVQVDDVVNMIIKN